jgi:hypothetical protein
MLADSDSATAEARKPTGIALNGAALNQPLAVQKSGDITAGGTLVLEMGSQPAKNWGIK